MAVWDDVLDDTDVEGHLGNQIVAEVAPRPGDLLVERKKPSAFFGIPLVSYLVALRADTVLELDEVLAYLDGLEPGLFDAEFPPAHEARGRGPVMLSARDVEEALKERLLRGAYPRGGALPSVRALAAELGTSPSTVGRAVQELARQGWVTATSRRGAVVRRDLPAGETGVRDAEAAIRRLAVRWRLVGGDRLEFQELVARVADEVFQPAPRTVFLECNPVDLQRGLEQVQRETSVKVEALLLEQAAVGSAELKDVNVLLTPYFHLAEARELAPEGAQVVPLNFVASEEAMRALVELPADTLVGVLAVDARSRRRLELIVQQYSAAAVLGALLEDTEAAAGLVEAADVILTTNAARLPGHLAARAKRLVRVGWALEPGGLGGWRASPEPAAGAG